MPNAHVHPSARLNAIISRGRHTVVHRLGHRGITQDRCRQDRLCLNLPGTEHHLNADGRDAIDNDKEPHGAGCDDGRVRRELCDVEKGGVVAEPGLGRLEMKETLAHVLV